MPEIQALLQGAQVVVLLGGGFYFAGRITKNLEVLTKGQDDHEHRLRAVEHDIASN